MKLSNTSEELDKAIEALGAVDIIKSSAYVNAQSLKTLVEEREPGFRFCFLNHSSPNPLQPDEGEIYRNMTVSTATDFLNLKAASDYAEAMPEVIESRKIIEPLVSQVVNLKARLASENEAASKAAQQRADEKQAAREKALAEIEARFAIAV